MLPDFPIWALPLIIIISVHFPTNWKLLALNWPWRPLQIPQPHHSSDLVPLVLFRPKKQSQKLPSAVCSFRWQNNTKRRTNNNNKHSGRFARNMVYMVCTLFGHGVWTWSSVFFDSVCARHPFPPEARPVRPAWVTGQLHSRLSLPVSLSISFVPFTR